MEILLHTFCAFCNISFAIVMFIFFALFHYYYIVATMLLLFKFMRFGRLTFSRVVPAPVTSVTRSEWFTYCFAEQISSVRTEFFYTQGLCIYLYFSGGGGGGPWVPILLNRAGEMSARQPSHLLALLMDLDAQDPLECLNNVSVNVLAAALISVQPAVTGRRLDGRAASRSADLRPVISRHMARASSSCTVRY